MLSSPPSAGPPLGRLVPTLSEALAERGHSVAWTPWGSTKTPMGRILRPVTVFLDAGRARRLARAHRAEFVMIHTAHDLKALVRDLVAVIALRRDPAPVIFFLHGSTPQWLVEHPGSALSRLTRAVLRGVDVLLVLSSDEATAWRDAVPGLSVVQVRNPLPGLAGPDSTDALDRKPQRGAGPLARVRLLFVGRLVPGKGAAESIQALAALLASRQGELRIAGAGPERPALESLARRLAVDEHVRFLGRLDAQELHEEYVLADLLVFPTRLNEGLPTVLLEAAALGLPAITSPVRGALDYFVDGETVFFVDPQDAPAIAAAIEWAMDSPELVARVSAALREMVEQFRPSCVVDEYEAVMDAVADARRSR